MAYKANFENRMDLDNPKDKLEHLVRNLFYQVEQRGSDMFLEYMKEEISKYVECEVNQATKKLKLKCYKVVVNNMMDGSALERAKELYNWIKDIDKSDD